MNDSAKHSPHLTHVGESGEARMVDVSSKTETHRAARATGAIRMQRDTLTAITTAQTKKGDVFGVARLAGIMAAKRTSDLIPLCHPLTLTDVQVELAADESMPGVRVSATVKTTGRTGVEMEALTAVSIALLTVYDMAKALDRSMQLCDIAVAEKDGGASGRYSREGGTGPAQ